MAIKDGLLPEFDHEMDNTRKALERVPEDKFGWKPHEKSGTMGWLADHIAEMVGWMSPTIGQDSLDMAGYQPPPPPTTRQQILDKFDSNRTEARRALEGVSDAQMMQNWKLTRGNQVFFDMPRVAVIRGMIMNHIIHHRGQLTVYLRLNNVPIPGLYGPSADEQTFG